MANDYEIFEFLEADYEISEVNSSKRLRRRWLREKSDPFNIEEEEFVRRYRLTKEDAQQLCNEIRPLFKTTRRSTDLSVEIKVLTALAFYATGVDQRPLGNQEGHSMAQQTVSSVIAQVTACLNTAQFVQKYIHFPNNDEERDRIKAEFYDKFKIPGVLGCIDCTHVAIVRPARNEEFYHHCKQHSLNVQLICDANMGITSVDANYGGATHDAFIWMNHPLRQHLEDLNSENTWLLGDSAYPLSRCLMTPVSDATYGSPERYYTDRHDRARDIMDLTIRALKARFRCLNSQRVLYYSPEMAASVVNACVVLHNICNRSKTPVELMNDEVVNLVNHTGTVSEEFGSCSGDLHQGWVTRSTLIHQLWASQHL
ncbi:putative nuclease HARBI1 [Pararge aegeria]|uniref:putative nuclease HARBI1 n=1 Tax=Pararge aegeria TaxID=116150 RepID=UPI0019D182BA|nr:putative nuclease HARBI1 [Pararge aegeria]